MRLVSWTKKGLDWGSAKEVEQLQSRICRMIEQGAELPNVIQIMLRRRILPFQDRASPMWAYKPEDPATVLSFFRTTHAQLWKVLFKPQKEWPAEEEDIGLDAANPPREVRLYFTFVCSDASFLTKHSPFFLLNRRAG
jgi:hypothetical protein